MNLAQDAVRKVLMRKQIVIFSLASLTASMIPSVAFAGTFDEQVQKEQALSSILLFSYKADFSH